MIAALLLLASVAAPRELPTLADAPAFSDNLAALQSDGRPVVLHFFATWCAPCVEEWPRLRPVLKQASQRGAKIALISLDDPHSQKALARFLRKLGLDAPVWLLTAPDPEPIAALLDPKWSGGLPATFVFQKGVRLKSFFGPMKKPGALLDALPKAH